MKQSCLPMALLYWSMEIDIVYVGKSKPHDGVNLPKAGTAERRVSKKSNGVPLLGASLGLYTKKIKGLLM